MITNPFNPFLKIRWQRSGPGQKTDLDRLAPFEELDAFVVAFQWQAMGDER